MAYSPAAASQREQQRHEDEQDSDGIGGLGDRCSCSSDGQTREGRPEGELDLGEVRCARWMGHTEPAGGAHQQDRHPGKDEGPERSGLAWTGHVRIVAGRGSRVTGPASRRSGRLVAGTETGPARRASIRGGSAASYPLVSSART